MNDQRSDTRDDLNGITHTVCLPSFVTMHWGHMKKALSKTRTRNVCFAVDGLTDLEKNDKADNWAQFTGG